MRKEIWKEIKYDEINFQRFHFYDADFTFSAAQRYKNFVYLNGDVYHYSAGKVNKDFCGSMLAFQKKWKYRLPCTLYKENRLKKNNVRILGIF